MDTGTRVRLRRDVERYPHFIAPEGCEGTITHADQEMIAVKLDEAIEGAEEWDNEVQWFEGMNVEKDFRKLFREDVEVVD